MRPRASAASGEMDPNAGMGLEETSAPPSVGSETNLKQNFDQVKLAAEPKQRKFTQSVQAAEGVMRAQLCKFCLKNSVCWQVLLPVNPKNPAILSKRKINRD